jgi:soluble lytic murein transglycosylase-like protein
MAPVKIAAPLFAALALFAGTAHADIYRYVSPEGTTVFTDRPPVGQAYQTIVKDPVAPRPARAVAMAPQRSASYGPASRARYASHIQMAAKLNNLDPALLHAVISAESGYNPFARSPKGAVGLMQLMPDTATRYNVSNRLDPQQNILGGARYLRDLLAMFNNDVRLAVAAYNAGEKAVVKYGNRVPPYPETVAYVPRVLNYYRLYGGRS